MPEITLFIMESLYEIQDHCEITESTLKAFLNLINLMKSTVSNINEFIQTPINIQFITNSTRIISTKLPSTTPDLISRLSNDLLPVTISILEFATKSQPPSTLSKPSIDVLNISNLKKHCIKIITFLVFDNINLQLLLIEKYMGLILGQLNHDDHNPFLKEYTVLLVKVLSKNDTCRNVLSGLEAIDVDLESNEFLDQVGLDARVVDGKVLVKSK